MKLKILILISLFVAQPSFGETIAGHGHLKEYLLKFHRDAQGAMNRPTAEGAEPFYPIKYNPNNFFNDIGREFRKLIMRDFMPYSQPAADDRVENLVEGTILKNLLEIDRKGLKKSALETMPWSDSYWPMARGLIGNRYADPGFPDGYSWSANRSYVASTPAAAMYASGRGGMLSPSEKYDLFVGDPGMALTQSVWAKGQYYFDTYGMVESWMGLCHGWAPASFMFAKPERAVEVTGVSGRRIRFYPSDIKAIASLLWGTTHVQPKFIGVKCKSRYPDYDEVGRITSENCTDTNAGTWHQAVVSQIGVNRRGLVMDATYNYEVWNHAIYSYEYVYFNPQTLEPTPHLNKAAVAMNRFTIDKFRKYRAPDAVSVVGVSMNLTYMVPIRSSHAEGQSNMTKTVNFVYDLELNAAGEIVGGEWYNNLHPDFLWTPAVGSRAISVGDNGIEPAEWSIDSPLPGHWAAAAQTASRRGQPLAAIVERLVEVTRAAPTVPVPGVQ